MQSHHEGTSVNEQAEQEAGKGRARRKLSEPYPWARFWWRDWLADHKVRRLTLEQRGRFMDVFSFTQGTDTPGVMTERDVMGWAGYAPAEWRKVRAVFAPLFDHKVRRGRWVLKSVLEGHEAGIRAGETAHAKAMKGVAARKRGRNELATTGTTPGATSGTTSGTTTGAPVVQPGDNQNQNQKSETRIQRTDKPEADSARSGSGSTQTSRSRAGSAGVAGSSGESPLEDLVARALRSQPPASGRSA